MKKNTPKNQWIDAGERALSRNEFEKAIRYFTMAIDKRPDYVEAYILRSKAYLHKGDIIKSSEDKKAAFDLDPDWVIDFYQLSNQQNRSSLFGYENIKYN